MKAIAERILQARILLHKNFLLLWRKKFTLALQLLFPTIIMFLLFILALAVDKTIPANPTPPLIDMSRFYPCKQGSGGTCMIALIGPDPANAPWVAPLAQQIGQNSGLGTSIGTASENGDVVTYSNGINYLRSSQTIDDMSNYFINNNNKTTVGVWFFNATNYVLFYNSTWDSIYENNQQPLIMQHFVDEAILQTYGSAGFTYDAYWQSYPVLEVKVQGQTLIFIFDGAAFLHIGLAFNVIFLLFNMITEKEEKLRFGMKVMGLKDSVYWGTWFLSTIPVTIISVLLMIGFGAAMQLRMFQYCNFFVLFLVFFCYCMSNTCFSMFWSVFVSKARTANLAGFGIIIFGLFFTLFFANGSGIYFWWETGGIKPILLGIFSILPVFHFSKCFADISFMAIQQQYDAATDSFSTPTGYTWADLYKSNLLYSQYPWSIPPTINAIWGMLATGLVYYILTWYLDAVLPSQDTVSKPFYFFLLPAYWGFGPAAGSGKKQGDFPAERSAIAGMKRQQDEALAATQGAPDVQAEVNAAFDLSASDSADTAAVRIVNLKKMFRHSAFREDPRKDIYAVRGLSMVCGQEQIMAILGHNGAGKTTTLSMLCGLYPPSEGEAYVNGLSIKHDMDQIRRQMGFCPQFDILWPDLTAREHLTMFCRFKGIPASQLQREVDERLTAVDLFKVGNNFVRSYSGGMKRRLSVAIACIGDPKLILLDECASGLDPQSRRNMWALVREMRKGRAIILTTHLMEEAEALSDKICIMSFGQLRTVGDSLSLKSRHGDGYTINVLTDDAHASVVVEKVTTALPAARLSSNNGGNVMFTLPFDAAASLPAFFRWVESDTARGNDKIIKDWSLSHTTLEEVYLKITKESKFGFGAGMATNALAFNQQQQQQQQQQQRPLQPGQPQPQHAVYYSMPVVQPQRPGQPQVYYAQSAGQQPAQRR